MANLANLKPFEPGHAPTPGGGRPKGSRSKLSEAATRFLYDDFVQHGREAIERVRQKQPHVYLTAVVSLLPKQQEKIESPFAELTDAELEMLENYLAAMRAKTVSDIGYDIAGDVTALEGAALDMTKAGHSDTAAAAHDSSNAAHVQAHAPDWAKATQAHTLNLSCPSETHTDALKSVEPDHTVVQQDETGQSSLDLTLQAKDHQS